MDNLFAERLNELLDDRAITKRALAREIGVSAMSVSDWTNGRVQPTAENIYIIAKHLDVSADFLLGLDE